MYFIILKKSVKKFYMIKVVAIGVIAFLAYYYYFSPVATCMRDFEGATRTSCQKHINK